VGLVSEFVVAAESDAEKIAGSENPAAEFDGVEMKGIDVVKLGVLQSALSGRPLVQLFPEYKTLAEGSDDGPWVTRIPDELVSALASMTDEERRRASDKWSKAEEFTMEQWESADVATALDSICEIARKAVSARKALLLWNSL